MTNVGDINGVQNRQTVKPLQRSNSTSNVQNVYNQKSYGDIAVDNKNTKDGDTITIPLLNKKVKKTTAIIGGIITGLIIMGGILAGKHYFDARKLANKSNLGAGGGTGDTKHSNVNSGSAGRRRPGPTGDGGGNNGGPNGVGGEKLHSDESTRSMEGTKSEKTTEGDDTNKANEIIGTGQGAGHTEDVAGEASKGGIGIGGRNNTVDDAKASLTIGDVSKNNLKNTDVPLEKEPLLKEQQLRQTITDENLKGAAGTDEQLFGEGEGAQTQPLREKQDTGKGESVQQVYAKDEGVPQAQVPEEALGAGDLYKTVTDGAAKPGKKPESEGAQHIVKDLDSLSEIDPETGNKVLKFKTTAELSDDYIAGHVQTGNAEKAKAGVTSLSLESTSNAQKLTAQTLAEAERIANPLERIQTKMRIALAELLPGIETDKLVKVDGAIEDFMTHKANHIALQNALVNNAGLAREELPEVFNKVFSGEPNFTPRAKDNPSGTMYRFTGKEEFDTLFRGGNVKSLYPDNHGAMFDVTSNSNLNINDFARVTYRYDKNDSKVTLHKPEVDYYHLQQSSYNWDDDVVLVERILPNGYLKVSRDKNNPSNHIKQRKRQTANVQETYRQAASHHVYVPASAPRPQVAHR